MYKIIGADGKEYGPISAETLRQWIVEGRANAQTKVLIEGTAEWKRLEELPDFSASLAGTAPPPAAPGALSALPTGPRNNSLAVTGLVFGILSLTFGLCCYGLPFNLAGIVCSLVALEQIRKDPQRERGRGLAIAGLVLSLLSILLASIFLLMYFAMGSPNWMRHMRRL